jgi:glycosyltransferase involved in cell wall biosynthesis
VRVTHLIASTFIGGPERQILGLCRALPARFSSTIVSFAEGGRAAMFLAEATRAGIPAVCLSHDTPRLAAALGELTRLLRQRATDLLCCHGYKADVLGLFAARHLRRPVVSVSRGWTGENRRVRLYDAIDRRVLRWFDRVVCVSAAQAVKVRQAGVSPERVRVIHNAVLPDRFARANPTARAQLAQFFAHPPARIVCAAGRLSPEKGFGVLIEAARFVCRHDRSTGFVLFGEGPLRAELGQQIAATDLVGQVILAGFRADLDTLLPAADLTVLPSYTEGLPNVVLESFAAGVPVVATAVGGTPEVIADGVTGFLVPPGDAVALARRIRDALADDTARRSMGQAARQYVARCFSFDVQSARYTQLFDELADGQRSAARFVFAASKPSPRGAVHRTLASRVPDAATVMPR